MWSSGVEWNGIVEWLIYSLGIPCTLFKQDRMLPMCGIYIIHVQRTSGSHKLDCSAQWSPIAIEHTLGNLVPAATEMSVESRWPPLDSGPAWLEEEESMTREIEYFVISGSGGHGIIWWNLVVMSESFITKFINNTEFTPIHFYYRCFLGYNTKIK